MTDCPNAEVRDLLPDLAGNALAPVEAARVQAHVDGCADCTQELVLLRTARALRPQIGPIDVARIVAQLPRPVAQARRLAPARVSRSVWRMAAAIGVIIAGGWSVVLVRSGGLPMMGNSRGDTAQLVDVVVPPTATSTTVASSPSTTSVAITARASAVTVSFGDLGDYTDEELQRVLDRLDKWDGATSAEAMSTPPILSSPRGGALE
ncbi:MAG: zf-HC2 domain-containing protein [Gemmatimonas sp.]